MKKYVKPELYHEDFELTEHIAAGCNFLMNFATDTVPTCTAARSGTLFGDRNSCSWREATIWDYRNFAAISLACWDGNPIQFHS